MVETGAEACVKSSESESRKCDLFSVRDRRGGSSTVGSVLITLAMRCNSAVIDAAGSERYLGGTKAAISTRRCTFAPTRRAVAICGIDGGKTEAAASGRLADIRQVSKVRGSRLGSNGSDNTW